MAKKLSEDDRRTIKRRDVTIELTINPQRGMTDVSEVLLPAFSAELTKSLAWLCERLYDEAEQIADVAEALVDRVDDEASEVVVARHCDAAKVSTDSSGSSVYLRVLITSTKQVPQAKLFQLGDSLMHYFRRLAFEMVETAESAATPCVDGRRSTSASRR